jgi:AbrB family looped-hinge helix DNA binding protein
MWHNDSMSDTYIVAVGQKGRIVIPAPLRAEIGVAPGDELVALAESGGLLLLPRQAVKERLRRMMAGGMSLADELLRERRDAAQRDAAD